MKHVAMKDIPSKNRPYERLIEEGAETLSESELLAIILVNGPQGLNVLDLATEVMSRFHNEEEHCYLQDASLQELLEVKGIGCKKAARIIAAIELGRRLATPRRSPGMSLSSPDKIAAFYTPRLSWLPREELHAAFLNCKNKLIREIQLSKGGLSSTVVEPRDLLREAVKANASAIVLAHNHPSGEITPSQEDLITTQRIAAASKLLGIILHDHIIIGKGNFCSLASDAKYSNIFR